MFYTFQMASISGGVGGQPEGGGGGGASWGENLQLQWAKL